MSYPMPHQCPACQHAMVVTELTCPECSTKVSGQFVASGLQQLQARQLQFVEVFLRCRGNIREVEKELGISYPTVRARLNQVLRDMGLSEEEGSDVETTEPMEILTSLEAGQLTVEEALHRLRKENER
ncbi:MAG: DUF2089 domain-containing protein [Alicyclobacillaceae bacterium]|nr:DUF2089 domain-containing protein [Alicyclobacillaceae bacterium]